MCQQHPSLGPHDHPRHGDSDKQHADTPLSPFPWNLPVYDAHCHPTDTMASVAAFPAMRAAALTVMATRSQDQDLVADVAAQYPAPDQAAFYSADEKTGTFVVPSFGWHPWFSYQLYDDQATEPTYRPSGSGPGQTPETSPEDAEAAAKAAHYSSVLTPAPSPSFLASLPTPIPISTFISSTRSRLLAHPHALVGEIGLDKAFRLPQAWDQPAEATRDDGLTPGGREGRLLSPHRVRMEHQRAVLAAQLRLAASMRRAVSVHGVQAHGVLYETLAATWKGHEREVMTRKKRKLVAQGAEDFSSEDENDDGTVGKPYPPRICLHSFSAGVEVIKQYLHREIPARIFVSLSAGVNLGTDASREKADEVVRALPDDRILVESDLHTAGEPMDTALEDVCRWVCEAKGWTIEEGVTQLAKNYEGFIYG
ncbi:Cut9-interacting protein scn1 [Neonectria magnoliae]|uniref:Cut9-interacting protein scn1 n=1 Tax=Neonectria magnoliae TaxID=2732573 RepID=A0ABR1IHY0_9HYPO